MKRNLYLWQPQYAVEHRKETTYWIPYSAGCLWSYASQFKHITDNWHLAELIFRREPPDEVLARIQDPVLCGFSCYIWNEKYCLSLAQMIKQRWPECKIVFGGAQASGKMINHNFIDSIIMAEGEENFTEVLIDIQENREVQKFYSKQRLENLDIPSPYTTQIFDDIIKKHPGALWSATFETNRGCPYSCTFCDWGGLTYTKVKKFDIERVRMDLEWCVDKPVNYLVCADANFGIFKERDVEIAKMIRSVADRSRIDSVNINYAKNSTDVVFTIAKILGDLSRGITVSVQSQNDQTLDAIKRKNLDLNNIKHIMDLSQQYDIGTYSELILALPLETLETWKQGLCNMLEMGQHNSIDIWFAQLLDASELAQPESRRKYGIKSIMAKDYMPILNPNDYKEIEEEIELICQTNTLSTEQLVECYMYGWMIMQLHIGGYSQIYAKYCRFRHDVSYRQFYDCMFDRLQQENFFQKHFQQLQHIVSRYLHTGEMQKLDGFKGGHSIHAVSYGFVYGNKEQAYALSLEIARTFAEVETDLVSIQSNFLFDPLQSYPIDISLPYSITSWQETETHYRIKPRAVIEKDFDFYRSRRQGLIKNHIMQV
jgi:putative methyltransferase